MNTCLSNICKGLCSWVPGSRAAPAPRNDNVLPAAGRAVRVGAFYTVGGKGPARRLS
jgi:hypothetical protein